MACGVAAGGIAIVLATQVVLFSRDDVSFQRCLAQPVPPGLPAGTVAEAVEVHGGVSGFPFGLECRYSASGVTVVEPPDMTGTVLVALAIALLLTAALIAAVPSGSRRRRPVAGADRSSGRFDDGRRG